MPAYATDLTHYCTWTGCGKKATMAVHNTANSPMGVYCTLHAVWKVSDLNGEPRAKPKPTRRTSR